jgi:hypothetical protein
VNYDFDHWPNEASDIAGMRREMALALIHHTSLWWFDMWGGYYQKPDTLANLRQMKIIWDRFADLPAEPVAEVAMVVDPESAYYVGHNITPPDAPFIGTRKALNRLGAPYEIFSLRDLPHLPDLDRYKLIVFPAQFEITAEKMAILRQFVLKNNRTVLWLYAPGISDGNTLDTSRVQDICGIPFGQAGLPCVSMGNWNSAYLYEYTALSPAELKHLAARAGVTLYCEEEVPVYANRQLVAVHVACGEKKQITLPTPCRKIVELYSGKIAGENTRRFTWNFQTPDTALFELTPA